MLKERKELEEHLINVIKNKKLKTKRGVVNNIVLHLSKNGIEETVSWINQPDKHIPELDLRELFLLTEQVYNQTELDIIKPDTFFTESEIKKSRQFDGKLEEEEELKFPFTLERMVMLNYNTFLGKISADNLARLSLGRKLHYNFDIQRESEFKRIKDTVIRQPKLVMQNVLEIKDNLKHKKQKHTQIVINAAIGSAESSEEELSYDPDTMRLTINRGTILDVVDGYHRTRATEMCYVESGHVDHDWILLLTNYSDKEAKEYQGQLAKQTPIAKERREALLGERKGDMVLERLIPNSELKDRVSQTVSIHSSNKELVSHDLLARTITDEFNLEKIVNVYTVADYLTKFFNFLLGTFEDEFLNNPNEHRKISLINHNNFIGVGYVVLARRMMENKIDPSEVIRIVSGINFDKNNSHWADLGIIDSKGRITDTPKARKAIKEYFENIEI
ncbi:MAG: hypothetical protein K0S80_4636 [Neobacillus sp.]|nr:hypothetical protein [Neobacillus sp.]